MPDDFKPYEKLKIRPEGFPPFATDDEDKIIVVSGERFCRFQVDDDDGKAILCSSKKPFNSTTNLRHHVNGHNVETSAHHNGRPTQEMKDESARLIRSLMKEAINWKKNNEKRMDYSSSSDERETEANESQESEREEIVSEETTQLVKNPF
ncbi:MAG: hypothetical protein M1837_002352 [Sclerophora amabilis]|nr:MAG: hypothetical protein M1837_002352 [Sclerophora amabilis]